MISKAVFFAVLIGVFLAVLVTETSSRRPPKNRRCKRFEVFSNCTNASCDPKTCAELGYNPEFCPTVDPSACTKGCVCQENYIRNSKNVCIPKRKCPSCGGDRNAVASECGQDCRKTCSNYYKKKVRCSEFCRPNRCECKKGYVLDYNTNKCVRLHQCTPVCSDDEVYSECTNGGCGPKNCSDLGFPVRCVKLDPASCIKGCVCKEEYVRDDNGICIHKNECPSCGGDPNAVSSDCRNICLGTCDNYNNTGPVVCSDICLPNSCECKEGFVLDKFSSKCILPEQCFVCNKEHEVYSDCANSGCDAKTCAQNGFKVPCVEPGSPECIRGCTCEDGYIRADNGTCILRSECPSCGGDPNAGQGCGIHCGRRCSDYMLKNVRCPLRACFINNCDCKSEYVFDDNIQRCVLPEDCTPTCKENEEYSSCVNGLCQIKYCSEVGRCRKKSCPKPKKCRGGCVCIANYLRDADGVCVPQEEC